ncbi:aspartate ammonia-lyase [Clostridium felsineum]|uniref:aspartate ammonia-lyase n=1 Tax=Clostridium felsineum TaxID=36839 RepID=A0A1S8LCB3_9CLOT|nr:aspartate ammonia-lyase [Clostridium felsineum]URZ02447.1 Aspartate ammonia-lyase [Clostridium felsineum]URZ04814.1 Aspartate ammonia-lyase [Clostridium felsineum]URZ09855.1 Aspartate ammonia-lyase [Clostridium felsineum]
MEFRVESDSIGEKRVPKGVYYGVQTLRGADNFRITGLKLNKEFIKSVVQIKKAAAITNLEIGILEENIGNAIIKACDEIIEGKFKEDFIIDPIQGGAGTSINMNANEVIANRAIELLGKEKGNYQVVHPNDHVNMGQSTNDVIPTAGKITALRLISKNIEKLKELSLAFGKKAAEFKSVIKMGRTQLQDAVPITLGQEFCAYNAVVKRDIARIERVKTELEVVNIGGTAVGTGINADSRYIERIVPRLSFVSGINLKMAEDLIDSTQNLDGFSAVSSAIKTCAVNLSKIANDLRLMSSGPRAGLGEINLPAKQNGSSIMPGKVNPVIPEVINQIAFNIIGNDVTVSMAVEAGQLELNAFEPVIFYNIFESIETLTNGIDTFIKNCVLGITANKEICNEFVNNSVGIVTALCPYIGYTKSARIAKTAIKTGESIKRVLLREGIFKEKEINSIINPLKMTKPGIVGK